MRTRSSGITQPTARSTSRPPRARLVANLRGADLSNVDLGPTRNEGADLTGAVLHNAA